MNEKNVQITKREHSFKGYTSSYNVKILTNFKILELQLNDMESEIENKLIFF